ncbi:MAG: helix-turn-helix transcriptional regulator [Clostridia bacterium]|nr:helix-turn-helix transcriptional regulator [Clostridia bacterium]
MRTVAERIKTLRTERNIGQNLLAKEIDVSNASISYWENAKQEPSAQAIYKLAQYFGVSADYILGIEDD